MEGRVDMEVRAEWADTVAREPTVDLAVAAGAEVLKDKEGMEEEAVTEETEERVARVEVERVVAWEETRLVAISTTAES